MCEGRCLAGTASGIIVAGVLNVSAFAQTDTKPRMLALERSTAGIVREYVATGGTDSSALPPNIDASGAYQGTLKWMLRHSATFRQQCRRIANAAVEIVIRPAARPLHGADARGDIVRRADGVLEATLDIARGRDAVQLIAHEIEHVIEQLDQIDLPARAAVADSGVRMGGGVERVFETTRAIHIGLKVAQEVRRGGG
jgi:hypothetical protein